MALMDECVRNFFIGLLLSVYLMQNVYSQNSKTYSQSNSVSWQGSSPFEDFWNPQNKNGLYFKLFEMLTNKNEAFKKLLSSDILAAAARINFKIIESKNKLNSTVDFHVILNTSADIQHANKETVTSTESDQKSTSKSTNKLDSENRPSKFDETVLERHNMYRKKHKASALVYSKKISEVSQDWANKLAEKDKFYHRPNNKYGENLYYSWNSNPNYRVQPNAAVDAWYSEIKNYTYSKNINIADVGHFTQLVWKNSKELGIGLAKSKTNRYYVVCNYSPPGNVIGYFAENVLRP